MKVCSKCGAINSDNKFFCVDCSEKLDEPLSESAQNRVEQEIDSNMDSLYNDKDPLFVSLTDKIFGIISSLCAVLSLIVLVIGFATKRDFSLLWVAVVCSVLSAIEAFSQKSTGALRKYGSVS